MPNSVLGTGRRVLCILQALPLRTFSQHNRSQYKVRWRAMSTVLQMVLELLVEFPHCDKKGRSDPCCKSGYFGLGLEEQTWAYGKQGKRTGGEDTNCEGAKMWSGPKMVLNFCEDVFETPNEIHGSLSFAGVVELFLIREKQVRVVKTALSA